jgi:hypothetical protein
MDCDIRTMAAYLASMRQRVEQEGWIIQECEGKDGLPTRCYTVGLTALRHPEIILLGFTTDVMSRLLHRASQQVHAGKRFADWAVARGIAQHYPVVFRELEAKPARQYTVMASRIYKDYRVVQMFLPDANAHFPWREGCAARYKRQLCSAYVSSSAGVCVL